MRRTCRSGWSSALTLAGMSSGWKSSSSSLSGVNLGIALVLGPCVYGIFKLPSIISPVFNNLMTTNSLLRQIAVDSQVNVRKRAR